MHEAMLETHLNRTQTNADERGDQPFVRVCPRYVPVAGLSTSNIQDCEQLPIDLTLPDDEVQIWRVALDLPASLVAQLQRVLAADEIARAELLRATASRSRFIAAHGLLRRMLGQYLNSDPQQLQFCSRSYGKPFLASAQSRYDVRFNLSHSHGLGLFAFTRGRDIGVDIEYLGARKSWERIARCCLSPGERSALYALPARAQQAALVACWTHKEAYLKATGQGLTLPLSQIDIGIRPGNFATPSYPAADRESSRWLLLDLAPGPGYVGALAVEGRGWRLAYRQWPEQI